MPPAADIALESDIRTVLYDVAKGRRLVANISEPVMEERNDAKKMSAHLRILMEDRLS
jgi:uncharacterized coiled-coil protein SlyX